MNASRLIGALLVAAFAATSARAQTTPTPTPPTAGRFQSTMQPGLTPNRDVILEVPELSVDSIGLTVSNVRAKVSLDANAMNLVQLSAGVDVGIKKVQLGIVGVYGEVYLYADLDNVARIVDRVVQTLDKNPKILTQVLQAVDTTVNAALKRPPLQ
jgi:hypothetical protein